MMEISSINVSQDLTLYYTGPSLDLGPLPSFFYFSLSGPDSLGLDPFNQPVQFLKGEMIRVFSLTLPGHENNLPATEAMQVWADAFAKGENPIEDFLERFDQAFEFALRNEFIQPDKIGVGGLSRGGFLAFHAMARQEKIRHAVAFAPVTKLENIKEFKALKEDSKISALNVETLKGLLAHKQIRIYVGNHDIRVGTKSCFDFASSLVDAAIADQIRSPKVEFSMYPSIGYQGHGTPPEIFRDGANWIKSCLISSS